MSAAAELSWTLQDAEMELRFQFENAPPWFAKYRQPGTITALNAAMDQAIADLTPPVMLQDLIDPQDRDSAEIRLREVLEGIRRSTQFESRSPVNGKRMRWTFWRTQGLGGKDCALAMADEVGVKSESEQHPQQAQRLEVLGRLTGGVAHDFNNLLTGVLLYCELLIGAIDDGHRARKYAEEIRKAAMQAAGVVRQLLAVARPSRKAHQRLSLNQVAESLQNLLARLIGENIELKVQLDRGLGLVRMNETEAQQIILNLVLNARDAMPSGGRIAVETSNCEVQVLAERPECRTATSLPCALLVVADNGTGIEESIRPHLFEAFFTTKGTKGTGLGLATVQDIVRANGGLIHVHSAPGRGTRVSVLLPLVTDEHSISQDDHFPYEASETQLPIHEGKTSL